MLTRSYGDGRPPTSSVSTTVYDDSYSRMFPFHLEFMELWYMLDETKPLSKG